MVHHVAFQFSSLLLHVKPRLHAWHSHRQSRRQSRSHFAFSSLSDQGEIRLFFIFRNSFLYKVTVSFTMVIKRSPGGQACRWRAINFEIHLWSSGKNADCIFGNRSASSMSKWRPAWTLTPEMIPFGTKSVTLSMLIDLLTSTMLCRSTQVKIASTDLWPQEMFTFSKMLALVESESSFGAYVCHRRPGGSTATSDLVLSCNRSVLWQKLQLEFTAFSRVVDTHSTSTPLAVEESEIDRYQAAFSASWGERQSWAGKMSKKKPS